MVMIDLGDEKKSLGVSSVTRVTETSPIGHLVKAGSGTQDQVSAYVGKITQVCANRTAERACQEIVTSEALAGRGRGVPLGRGPGPGRALQRRVALSVAARGAVAAAGGGLGG